MKDRLSDYTGDDPKFRAWMGKVDAAVEAKWGISLLDLPDAPFYDWFSDGIRPSAAAKMAVKEDW